MRTNTKRNRAYGNLFFGYDTILGLLAQGRYAVEKIHTMPEIPSTVWVSSVHNSYERMGFCFILESEEPVKDWTDYVEEGCVIPLSPVSENITVETIFRNAYLGIPFEGE